MSGDDRPPSLEDFDARLAKAREARRPADQRGTPTSGLGPAMRLAVELVAAVAVSSAIGWVLDGWLGTRPWLMIVFLVLGFAAGGLNAYRVVSGYDSAVGFRRGGTAADEDEDD